MPVSDLHGSLVVRARAGRDSADAPPEIQMHAHTRDLAVAGKATAISALPLLSDIGAGS